MQLNEKLHICLLALVNRFPDCVVVAGEEILGAEDYKAEGWPPNDLIEALQWIQPELLEAQACLTVDSQRSEIALTSSSEEVLLFGVYCRGKKPGARKKAVVGQMSRRRRF